MEENTNNVNEVVETNYDDEVTDVTCYDDESNDTTTLVLAIAGIAAAGYAAGKAVEKVVIPGVKKAFGWVKGLFTKKQATPEPSTNSSNADNSNNSPDSEKKPEEKGEENN